MENCEVSMLEQIYCKDLCKNCCAQALNAGVPGGELSKMKETFKTIAKENLRGIIASHSEGGYWEKKCMASPQIVEAGEEVSSK